MDVHPSSDIDARRSSWAKYFIGALAVLAIVLLIIRFTMMA
tara:strand:+ start:259 stop:381 length:123 start_codon:yes stop_codon:yes gene_type:complete